MTDLNSGLTSGVLGGIVAAVTLGLAVRYRGVAKEVNGSFVLSRPLPYRLMWAGLTAVLIPITAWALVAAPWATPEDQRYGRWLLVFMLMLDLVMCGSALYRRFLVDEEGIAERSLWRGWRRTQWSAIDAVEFNTVFRWLTLHSPGNGTFRIDPLYSGIDELLALAAKHVRLEGAAWALAELRRRAPARRP